MPQIQITLSADNKITHDLTEELVTVGRLADNTLQVDDGSISSHHAKLQLEEGRYHLYDLESTNGTYVNGEQIGDAILRHGDEVRFGRVDATFTSQEASGVSQPLPESSAVTAEVATESARPSTFVSSSPVPKNVKTKDTLGMALLGLAGVSLIAFAAAIFFIFSLQTPAA